MDTRFLYAVVLCVWECNTTKEILYAFNSKAYSFFYLYFFIRYVLAYHFLGFCLRFSGGNCNLWMLLHIKLLYVLNIFEVQSSE